MKIFLKQRLHAHFFRHFHTKTGQKSEESKSVCSLSSHKSDKLASRYVWIASHKSDTFPKEVNPKPNYPVLFQQPSRDVASFGAHLVACDRLIELIPKLELNVL